MNPTSAEEVWCARTAIIFGAKGLVDVALNFATILKVHSGLLIYSPSASTEDRVAVTYLITSAIVGVYLTSGGRLFSHIAYGQAVPRSLLLSDVGIPNGSGWLSVAFRAFGVLQLIQAVTAIGLSIAHYRDTVSSLSTFLPRMSVVESVWALEHLVIGFTLLLGGGKLAFFFLGGVKPNHSTQPPPATGAAN